MDLTFLLRIMPPAMVLSIVRSALLAGFASLAAKGYVDGNYAETIIGLLMNLATAAWGAYSHSPNALKSNTLALPDVAALVHTDGTTVAAPFVIKPQV